MPQLAGSKTHDNLKAAFAGESQANRRYLYFAKIADIEGEPNVAGLFRDTAEGETGHAHGHLDYLKRVGDPATDLPIGSTEKNLAEYGDKIPEDKKASIDAALGRLKEVHKDGNVDEVDSAMEQLNQAWSAASEDLYKAQQEEAGGDGATDPTADASSTDAQDADFEVVDEGEEQSS